MNAKTQARIGRIMALRYADAHLMAIELALILAEQDADTRHACAEAMDGISHDWDVATVLQLAHQARINTQAV